MLSKVGAYIQANKQHQLYWAR